MGILLSVFLVSSLYSESLKNLPINKGYLPDITDVLVEVVGAVVVVVVVAVVVVVVVVVQQSEVAVKKLGQLSVPHSRFPAQSSSTSQSPSKSPHGFELEQHDHVSSVDQLHPAKLGSESKNKFDNTMSLVSLSILVMYFLLVKSLLLIFIDIYIP